MNQPLKTFKQEYQNLLVNFLWRQWSALGVAGQAGGEDAWIIDPEALLLLTCTLGRHEPRLFDEVLDWLRENGRFINVMRLKRILQMEKFAGERVLTAVAGVLAKGTEATKWKMLANSVEPSAAMEVFFLRRTANRNRCWGSQSRILPDADFVVDRSECADIPRNSAPLNRPTLPSSFAPSLVSMYGASVCSTC